MILLAATITRIVYRYVYPGRVGSVALEMQSTNAVLVQLYGREPRKGQVTHEVRAVNRSWLAFASAIYSDAHDDSATTGCCLELHVPDRRTVRIENLRRNEKYLDHRWSWRPGIRAA